MKERVKEEKRKHPGKKIDKTPKEKESPALGRGYSLFLLGQRPHLNLHPMPTNQIDQSIILIENDHLLGHSDTRNLNKRQLLDIEFPIDVVRLDHNPIHDPPP